MIAYKLFHDCNLAKLHSLFAKNPKIYMHYDNSSHSNHAGDTNNDTNSNHNNKNSNNATNVRQQEE